MFSDFFIYQYFRLLSMLFPLILCLESLVKVWNLDKATFHFSINFKLINSPASHSDVNHLIH